MIAPVITAHEKVQERIQREICPCDLCTFSPNATLRRLDGSLWWQTDEKTYRKYNEVWSHLLTVYHLH